MILRRVACKVVTYVATCTSLSRRSLLSIAIKFSSKSSTEGRRSRETWMGGGGHEREE